MPCGPFMIANIPDANTAAAVAAGLNANDPQPISVTTIKTNGTWTVTAIFPPCTPDATDIPD